MELTRPEIAAMVQQTPPSGKRRSLGLLAATVTLGSFLFGYDTGVIAGALPYMYLPHSAGGLGLNAIEEGLVGGILAIGAAFGAIIGGQLSDRFGRRANLLGLAIVFVVGTIGCSIAPNIAVLYASRFVLGWAVGGASSTVPIYLAESAPQRIRGPLVAIDQFMIVFGQLVAYTMNAWLSRAYGGPQVQIQADPSGTFPAGSWQSWDEVSRAANVIVADGNGMAWRYMLVLATIPAIALWIGMRLLPESARWYGTKQRYYEAIGALKRIRTERDDVVAEVEQIVELTQSQSEEWSFRQTVRVRWTRRILVIGIMLGCFDQLTGINTAMYYLPKVLHAAGFSSADAISLNVITGIASTIGAGVGLLLIARWRRRQVGIYQESGIVVSLFALSLVFGVGIAPYLDADGNITGAVPPFLPWVVLVLVAVFVFFKQSGTVSWVLMSEIFPAKIRGVGQGIAVGAQWIMNAIVTFSFPLMIAGLGAAWTYAIFGAINVLALLFYWKIVPETKTLSLEELERALQQRYS